MRMKLMEIKKSFVDICLKDNLEIEIDSNSISNFKSIQK